VLWKYDTNIPIEYSLSVLDVLVHTFHSNLLLKVRALISDFAVFIAICVMVFIDFMVGLDTDKLRVPLKFEVSSPLFQSAIYPMK
jgi:HCO3- transporter family